MNPPDQATLWDEHDPVSEWAADFFAQRRFAEWTEADQAALDAWLAESDLHRAAYLRLEGAAAYADNLISFRAKPDTAAARAAGGIASRLFGRRFVLPLLAAASVAVFATLGIPFVKSLLMPPDRSFSTDIGGRTLLKFADGTEIELNTDTVMRFRMTTAERTVWLDRGEAWFHVAHDAAHPFSVIVDNHRVTDLGTEFYVRRGQGRMEVALLAGRAMLATEGTPAAMLTPGDDAVATPVSLSVTRRSPRELSDALAWRRGMLVFRKARLADVVREFNRYNTTKLVIADPSIANVEITAEMKTSHYDDLVALVQTVLNFRADREGNDILISRDAAKAKRTKAAGGR